MQLSRELAASEAERHAMAPMRERAARELNTFLNALDEVEQAGTSLSTLPRARLLEIQRVLRDGVSGPNG